MYFISFFQISGVANIVIDIYALVSLYWMHHDLEANEQEIWSPYGLCYKIVCCRIK